METETHPQNGEKSMRGRPVIDKTGKCGQVDLVYFVAEVERFNRLIEPVAMILYALEDIRRWRYPSWTLGAWILCNLGCIILSKGAVFALVSLLVVGIATLCLVQVHTRLLDKFLPRTGLEEETDDNEELEEAVVMKTVQYFRFSVVQMYGFVVKCNEYMAHFYGILKWEQTIPSLKFHIELCVFLLSLVVLPPRGVWFIIINWFFLANEDTLKVIIAGAMNLYAQLTGTSVKVVTDGTSAQPKEIPSSNSTDQKSTENNQTADKDHIENSGEVQNVDTIVDKANVTGTGPGKQGMVARLREIKKKRQHIANESCFKCETSFSSILKRRYYCRHCGNHFCSKCCNLKVPKSMFGATSPAAQTETVLVCNVCHELLTKEEKGKEKKS